jgi:hypothetical protein
MLHPLAVRGIVRFLSIFSVGFNTDSAGCWTLLMHDLGGAGCVLLNRHIFWLVFVPSCFLRLILGEGDFGEWT